MFAWCSPGSYVCACPHCRFDTGIIGGSLLFIVPEFQLAPLMQGWIVSASVLGSLAGTLAASRLADTAGRRGTMRIASVAFVVAALLLGWSPTVTVLIAGRALMGLGVGLSGRCMS